MSQTDFGEWRAMATAPRDGTRILVALRASEQGPAEVDVARWERNAQSADFGWVASDSDPACVIVYAESDLAFWMPLPTPTPPLRAGRRAAAGRDVLESDGSAI